MSYHTNTSTSIQNAPNNVLMAPKDLLNRLMPGRYPVDSVTAIHDMMSQDLINHLTEHVFRTYNSANPRGFASGLGRSLRKFLAARGHKVIRVFTLYGDKRVTVTIITNGGSKTFECNYHRSYGLMYSSCDGVTDEMTRLMKKFPGVR